MEIALVDAVRMAIKAEQEAVSFYERAAENTSNPRGRQLFSQLVSFEKSHFAALSKYLKTLDGGLFVVYKGTAFKVGKIGKPDSPLTKKALKTDIDALTVAIESETRAQAAYLDLAQAVSEPEVVAFFNRLAGEEGLHKKVLEEQFFALANKGHWTWGE